MFLVLGLFVQTGNSFHMYRNAPGFYGAPYGTQHILFKISHFVNKTVLKTTKWKICWTKLYSVRQNNILLDKIIFCQTKSYFVRQNHILLDKIIFFQTKFYFVRQNHILLKQNSFCPSSNFCHSICHSSYYCHQSNHSCSVNI